MFCVCAQDAPGLYGQEAPFLAGPLAAAEKLDLTMVLTSSGIMGHPIPACRHYGTHPRHGILIFLDQVEMGDVVSETAAGRPSYKELSWHWVHGES